MSRRVAAVGGRHPAQNWRIQGQRDLTWRLGEDKRMRRRSHDEPPRRTGAHRSMLVGVPGPSAAGESQLNQQYRLSDARTKSQRKRPDQASKRRERWLRPAQTQRWPPLVQIDVQRKAAGPCGHRARATDSGPLLRARYGQNESSIAQGRHSYLFAGSEGGARNWAILASLLNTARLNGVDPLTWLTDVLERIVSGRTKSHQLHELLPWNWKAARTVEPLKEAA